VLNHTDPHTNLTLTTVEQSLRHRITLEIPYDHRTVSSAEVDGSPLVISSPQAPISQALRELARVILPAAAAAASATEEKDKKKKRSLFARR